MVKPLEGLFPPKRDFKIWGILFLLQELINQGFYFYRQSFFQGYTTDEEFNQRIELLQIVTLLRGIIYVFIFGIPLTIYIYYNFKDMKILSETTHDTKIKINPYLMAFLFFPLTQDLVYFSSEAFSGRFFSLPSLVAFILTTILSNVLIVSVYFKYYYLYNHLNSTHNENQNLMNPYIRSFLVIIPNIFYYIQNTYSQSSDYSLVYLMSFVVFLTALFLDYQWQEKLNQHIDKHMSAISQK